MLSGRPWEISRVSIRKGEKGHLSAGINRYRQEQAGAGKV